MVLANVGAVRISQPVARPDFELALIRDSEREAATGLSCRVPSQSSLPSESLSGTIYPIADAGTAIAVFSVWAVATLHRRTWGERSL